MGIDSLRFVSPVDEEFICSICQDILEEPMQIIKCQHSFCSSCINEWLNVNATCPLCKINNVTHNDIIPVPKNIINLINKLIINCDFVSFGCDLLMNFGKLACHAENCKFNPENQEITCEDGCGKTMIMRQFIEHTCELEDVLKKIKELKKENKAIKEENLELNCKNNELTGANKELKHENEEMRKSSEEFIVVIKSDSDATMRVRFNEMSNLILNTYIIGHTYIFLRNLKWRMAIRIDSEWFGIFLYARNLLDEREWTCKVSSNVKLVSQKDGVESEKSNIDHVFTSNLDMYGFNQFIKLSDLLDLSKGYIMEDSILCEITIHAEQSQFINRNPNKAREFLKAIEDHNGSNDFLTYKKGDFIEQLYPIGNFFMGKLKDGKIGEFFEPSFEKIENFEYELTSFQKDDILKTRIEGATDEATLRFSFDRLNQDCLNVKLMSSSYIFMRNLRWRIMVQLDEDSMDANDCNWLGIFLIGRNMLNEQEWTCKVSFDAKIISQTNGMENLQFSLDRVFSSNSECHGISEVITLSELFNTVNGYIKENSIICEVTIFAEEIQFIARDPSEPRVFVKANRDWIEEDDHLSFKKGDIIEQLYPIGSGDFFMGKMESGPIIGLISSLHVDRIQENLLALINGIFH